MRKPKIGIIANKLYMETPLVPNMYRAYVNNDYVESVEKTGGVPVMLPVISNLEDAESQISGLDGIIISGGYDVDPLLYGEEPIRECGFTMNEIDVYYLAIVKAACKMQIPILGICKGAQVMNIAFGGTLYQDLGKQKPESIKHSQNAARYKATHSITTVPGSFLCGALGEKSHVNSYHHQAIRDLGKGFVVTATAPDGIIEAIERIEGSFMCGVQFHPEMMTTFNDKDMTTLFKSFINKCQ